jgi:hypothetical protein
VYGAKAYVLTDDALFELELRTPLIAGKATGTSGADDEFDFIVATHTCDGIAAQLTEIALKDFHGDIANAV